MLKPCPFCGSKSIELEGVSDWPDPTEYVATCQKCGSTGSVEATEERATKTWNRRA